MAGRVRALGEIALRVNDLDTMHDFYERVVGLQVLRRFPTISFFSLGESYGGHTAVLALFDRDAEVGQASTTLDHLAFAIDAADVEAEHERIAALGVAVTPVVFEWTGWRSLFFSDPEGNQVELVSRDPALTPDWGPLRDQPPPVGA